MVYTAPLLAVFGLLLLLAARPVDGCVPSPGSTGCQCDAGASCNAIWFSCRQDGAATINNIGLAFTYGQPQRTDPGYRWYIANGNGGPTYPGQTSGFVDGAGNPITIPYIPYSTNSVGGSGSPTSPQWLTSGINPLTSSNPVTTGGWACTVDSLLQRSLNGGIGPTQPKCQYGTAPPVGVSTTTPCNPCCQPVKLFDGFSNQGATGWQLASAAAITSTGAVAEYPAASVRAQPQGAGIGTVDTSNGLADGELRQIVTISGSGVDMKCFISLFDPCNICPTPQPTPPTPGCCPSGQQLVNGACCPTSSIVTTTNPPTCCPAGGPWVVCTGSTTNCQQAVQPNTAFCCPAAQWIQSSAQCCPSSSPRTEYPAGSGQYVCCPSANVIGGQCCDPALTQSTIVDGACCPNAQVINFGGTNHCCKYCNVNNQQLCSGTTPAPTSGTYTWMSSQFCCSNALLNNGVCCPSCVTSPTTVNTDLRNSGDCGRSPGGVNCCPAAQVVSHVSTTNKYCCPAGTTYDATYRVVDRAEGLSGARCCPGNRIKCDGSTIAYICCSDSTDVCSSASQPCCSAAEARQPGCCVNTAVARGCDGSATTPMTTCVFLGEGNCCPTGAVTRDASNNNPACCYGQAGGPTWVQTPACAACNRGAGTNANTCCPAANVATNPPTNPPTAATAVACCPSAMSNYGAPTRSLSGANTFDYCCPTGQITAGNSATGTAGINFCCPGSGYTIIGTGNTFGAGDGVQCCLTSRVPVQPGTSTPVLDVNTCCPNTAGVTWYWINGACCQSTNAVQDGSGGWHCCPGVTNPLWLNGACCNPNDALTNGGTPIFCCPNGNSGTLCTAFPPTGTCYVYNGATGGWIVKDPNGNPFNDCCPANRISYTGTASATTTYFCCPGTAAFQYTLNDECCPPTRVPTTWDGVARFSPQTGYPNGRTLHQINDDFCCPSSVIAGATYTQTYATQGTYNADCCPQIQVNKDAHTNALVATDQSMCCNTANSYLVDQQASALSSSYLYCCPSNQLLPATPGQAGTTYHCCENALQGGEIWFTSTPPSGPATSGCCKSANIITNPTTPAQQVCCPSTGYTWTDTAPSNSWPGGVAHCCDARFALPTTVAGLANSYCCPTNTPSAPAAGIPGSPGNPSSNPWQVFRRVPTSPVNNGTSWSSVAYQCCDPNNKQNNLIVDNTGASVSICCPGPNLVYIIGNANHQPSCCPNDTIKYDVGHDGDLRYATCCPANANTSAISETTGALICCPNGKFNGIDTCCDAPSTPQNPAPTQPVPTINDPCCNVSDRLSVSGFPWNLTGEYLCCPPLNGKPAPFVDPFIDPTLVPPPPPHCCYGYSPVQPPRACCANPTDFNTPDDPCCDTTTRADGTCCPANQWIPGPSGAPHTGTCCLDTETIINNGTVISCCATQYADVTGTVCCLPSAGVVLDDQGNCCPTSVINTDPITGQTFCCGPSQRDDFGVCCTSAQTIHTGAVFNGVANASVRICCDNNSIDCAGICYWKDPLGSGNIAVPYDTQDANGVCCPNRVDVRDCAGLCPDPVTGLPINTFNATFGDCCPPSQRDCGGVCYGRDRNCCENPTTSADCATCIGTQGCGWCSSPFSSSGSCLSGNHFGPYTDPSGLSPCDAGNRWVINPPSEIISQSGTFADGWNMQYKNYTVTLSPNKPLAVNFTVRVPANVPLDLYILQDGTASFGTQVNGQPSSLENFQSVLPNLLSAIQTNVTSDLTVGFGLFADKPVEPFGYWSGATFDYLWRNLAPLTTNYASVVSAVNALRNIDLSGGSDIPEGQLEALLALGVRFSEVGWRQPTASFSSNHVVLVVTDAPPHKASLGQPFNANGPFDLSYWIDTNAPLSAVGLNNYARSQPPWVPNDGLATFTPGQCGIRPQAASVTPPYPREGICMDYPSFAQTITALQTQSIAPVFVVAPTKGVQPINVQYPTDIAFSEWIDFVNTYAAAEGVPAGQFGLVANLTGVGTAAGAAELQQAILNALYQITQTIALRVISGGEWVTGVSPTEVQSAIPGQEYTFTVTLFWNGTWPGFDGPHPVDVLSLFPKTNFPIEPGHIDIFLSKPLFCGYCGDGIVQPEINETCEPGVAPPAPSGTDLPCCNSECQIERNLCNGLARCSPSVCNANGLCQDEPVTCTPIIDAVQSLCSTNSCINGQCVVSCFGANDSNPCCDDGDNCTRDTCVSGVCRHDFELPCDCGGNPAYNSCFACIAVSNTTCGWDLSTGTCVNVNITDLLLHPENYGIDPNNASVVVYEQDVADKRCVAERAPASKVGIIVGVIAGVAALAALIALAAVFGGRIREIAQRIFGSTSASGSAANKVLDNPAYEVAIEGQSPIYKS